MFVLNDFLRRLSPELLQEYCQAKGVNFLLPKKSKPEEIIRAFSSFLNTCDPVLKDMVEFDFQEIKDIVSEKGTIMLYQEAKARGQEIPNKDLEAFTSYDKATWFYINHKDIFDQVAIEYELDRAVGWLQYSIVPSTDLSRLKSKRKALAEAVSDYYFKREGRGRICMAEFHQKDDLLIFVVSPEDYAQKEPEYDVKQNLNKGNYIRPIFKAYFLVDPSQNRISVKAKGGNTKKDDLIKLFSKVVLGQKLDNDNKVAYNLDVLKDFNLDFPTPPEDEVEMVSVPYLRISYPRSENKDLVFNLRDRKGKGLVEIGEWINGLNIPINDPGFHITQAKVFVKFKPEIKRGKGTVTTLITNPSSCDLGFKKLDRKVKGYLQDWRIDSSIHEGNL